MKPRIPTNNMANDRLADPPGGGGAYPVPRTPCGVAQRANRWLMVLEQGLVYTSASLLLVMMFITVSEITLRKLTGYSIEGVFEGMELMLVAVVYLGLAHVQSLGKNVKVDLLIKVLPFKSKQTLEIITMVPVLAFLSLATWMTAKHAWASWLIKETTFIPAELPIWAARALVAIGFLFLWLRFLIQVGERIFSVSGAPGPETVSS